MTANETIEIVCGTDENYVPHLGVMLRSLVTSNPRKSFTIYVLHDGVGSVLKDQINSNNPELTIHWIEVIDKRVLGMDGILHISRATYLRLKMAELLPRSVARVLYLDIDLVVHGDLQPLWNTQMGGAICAGVIDPGINVETFKNHWNLKGPGFYFNAGVILFDVTALRETDIMEEALRILSDPATPCEWADQDALNIVLWGKCKLLDPKWNFQRKFLYDKGADWARQSHEHRRPAIIHYTEGYKPWRRDEWHPCGWLYLRALLKTPFRENVLRSGQFGAADIAKSWLRWHIKRPPMFNLAN